MSVSLRALPKSRLPTTREQRIWALQRLLSEAPSLGVTEAWLVGSMARGQDNPLSDVDLLVSGSFALSRLYDLRDRIYLESGVVIQLSLEPLNGKGVKVI